MEEASVLQIGTGHMTRSRARQLIGRWKRLARGGVKSAGTETEWRGALAASGIGLTIVPREGAASG